MNASSTQAAALISRVGVVAKSDKANMARHSPPQQKQKQKQERRSRMSSVEARWSLILAVASQSASLSQRVLSDIISETAKYVVPTRFEQALMSVPDLETLNYKVLTTKDLYQIREIQAYFVAETTMPGTTGFDFYAASHSFNVLAQYLFGQNVASQKMEMTTPVITRRASSSSDGVKMEMTTPVITSKVDGQDKWEMSFVMPSKYGPNFPLPKDSSVRIKEVAKKVVAVSAFSGYVTDEEVKQRELKLRKSLENDKVYKVQPGVPVEISQYNPPFSLPFTRRNEIALEVERRPN